jgi:hypothetical protein
MRSISPFGPSRHFAWAQQSGRFWREADINGWARLGESVVIDPNRAFGNDGNLHQGPWQAMMFERLENNSFQPIPKGSPLWFPSHSFGTPSSLICS